MTDELAARPPSAPEQAISDRFSCHSARVSAKGLQQAGGGECGKTGGGRSGQQLSLGSGLTGRNNGPGMPGTPPRQLSLQERWGWRWAGGYLKGTSKNGIVWVLLSPTQAKQMTKG